MRDTHRFVPFVYIVIDPYMLEQSKTAIVQFAPSENLIDYNFLVAKVEAAATGINFVVFEMKDGEHLMSILMLGKQLTFRIILPSDGEVIAHIPLENDQSFKQMVVGLCEVLDS